jgi:hypothetical protein
MRSNTCRSNTLAASSPYEAHTASRIFKAGCSLCCIIDNPLREPDGARHFDTKVTQLLRKLFKAAWLPIDGFEF